jgi:hypothetical protein
LNELLARLAPLERSLLARVLLHESDHHRGHVLVVVGIVVVECDQELWVCPV